MMHFSEFSTIIRREKNMSRTDDPYVNLLIYRFVYFIQCEKTESAIELHCVVSLCMSLCYSHSLYGTECTISCNALWD